MYMTCLAYASESEMPVKVVAKSWVGGGFFAELKNVLFNLIYHCDHKVPKRLVVDWSQELFPYKDDRLSNGWDLYFEPIDSLAVFENRHEKRPPKIYHDQNYCTQRWQRYDAYLPYRQFLHDHFTKYITIKPRVMQMVDAFYDAHLAGHFCIGIHVRFATAHGSESPYQSQLRLEDYIEQAALLLEEHSNQNPKLFIATDSDYVVAQFKKHFHPSTLCTTDAFRASYREDPHLIYEHQKYYKEHPDEFQKDKPGYFGGLTALVDCLLLSKCAVMIHSLSNVSDFVTVFNPSIRSLFLPKNIQLSQCSCESVINYFK